MTNAPDDETRDELLLTSLMDLVPQPYLMKAVKDHFTRIDGDDGTIIASIQAMLKGYGTLLNVIQAATENEGSMTDRLYAGYYELTNNEG